jgi:hypothetical protein
LTHEKMNSVSKGGGTGSRSVNWVISPLARPILKRLARFSRSEPKSNFVPPAYQPGLVK